MRKMVKCHLCGKLNQTRGKNYFRCCQMAWEIKKCQVSSYDDARYVIPAKSPDDEIIRIVDEIEKTKTKS